MLHLPSERLAALADEPATTDEGAHLAACPDCAREVTAYKALAARAREAQADIVFPLASWETLGRRLRDEGLIARRSSPVGGWRELAAAALLFAVGTGAGIGVGMGVGRRAERGTTGTARAESAVAALAGGVATPSGDTSFSSVGEALAALERHQRAYQAAAAYLSAKDTAAHAIAPEAVRTRLAALDAVAARTHEALREAPYDPVINRYYLSTQTVREATIRQLGAALPVGYRLTRY